MSADVYCKRTSHLNFDWHCSLTLAKSSSLVMTMVISRMENYVDYVDFYVHLEQLKVRLYLYSARTFAKLSHVSKSYHPSYHWIILISWSVDPILERAHSAMVHKDTCIWRWEPPFQLSVGPRITSLTVLAPKTNTICEKWM